MKLRLSDALRALIAKHQAHLDNGTLHLDELRVEEFRPPALIDQAYRVLWGSRPADPNWPIGPGPKHDPECVEQYFVVTDGNLKTSTEGSVRELVLEHRAEFLVFSRLQKTDSYFYDVESGLDATRMPPDRLRLVVFRAPDSMTVYDASVA